MRVLIATVTAGGGHLAAAAALEEAWRQTRPDDVVERLDLGRFFSPLHRKVYSQGYLQVADHAPELWGMLFKQTDRPDLARKLSRWKRALPSASRTKFSRHLAGFDPDVVLCTHYLPLEALGKLRAKAAASSRGSRGRKGAVVPDGQPLKPFVVSVVTDFEAHALWMDDCVDLYCVAAEQTRARLIARGADPAIVVPTGIPISPRFSVRIDPAKVRKNFGLRDDLPVVLVLSGGFGTGPVAECVAELDKVAKPFQMVVVAGRNEELRRDLAARDRKHPTHVLGFVTTMPELMAAADLILSKPGGLTTSEALAMGKPLFIVNPIPGQEAANSDFLLEQGAGAKVNRVEDLPFRVEQLLGSRKLAEMGRAAKALGRPKAANAICAQVVSRLTQAAEA
jgi:processive 1,2-diacylglycerol beta-glucosyltransferase